MCRQLELISNYFLYNRFSTISCLDEKPKALTNKRIVWHRAAHWHKPPTHQNFSFTIYQDLSLSQIEYLSGNETLYFLLRNSFLMLSYLLLLTIPTRLLYTMTVQKDKSGGKSCVM